MLHKRAKLAHRGEASNGCQSQDVNAKASDGSEGIAVNSRKRIWVTVPEVQHDHWSKVVPKEFESASFQSKLLGTFLRQDYEAGETASGLVQAPLKERKALFVLGPSAAGKSSALRFMTTKAAARRTSAGNKNGNGSVSISDRGSLEGGGDIPLGSYILDGANFRSASDCWKTLLEQAQQHRPNAEAMASFVAQLGLVPSDTSGEAAFAKHYAVAGFSDGYKKYFKKPTDKLKKELTDKFVKEGCHCSQNPESVCQCFCVSVSAKYCIITFNISHRLTIMLQYCYSILLPYQATI
jgi:hypothetical protein